MCVVLVTNPELQPLDLMMIVLEIVLFFTGAFLTIAFSLFAFVAAHIRSRVLLLAVSLCVCVCVRVCVCACVCIIFTLFFAVSHAIICCLCLSFAFLL